MFHQRGPDSFPGGVEAFVILTLGVLAVFLFVVLLCTGSADAARRPDAWITTKLRLALLTAPEIRAMPIDVDTSDGRVTLHGTVRSESESAAAERIAREVAGVSDVRNLLAVVPPLARPAVREADDVVRKRVDGVRGAACEISSPDEVSDAEIWRAGKPASPGTLAAAEAAAIDLWTGAEVKTRLFASGAPASDIDVDAEDGVVTLFGIVLTLDDKESAEDAALGAVGVRRVDSVLQVVPGTVRGEVERRDRELERTIAARLAEPSGRAFRDIRCDVRNGIARLSGRVDRPEDGLAALERARKTPGVRSVLDDLEVVPPGAGATDGLRAKSEE